jgi:HTH-type transcriptional regulator/antitoxin HigA
MTTSASLHSSLPLPPGEYLLEVLQEKGLTQSELARRMRRPLQPINEIVHGKNAITAETALQLEHALGVPAHIWTGLEAEYRLTLARNAAAGGKAAKRRRA